MLDAIRARGERTISGEEVFRLYDTFGIPVDLIGELAEEEGVTLDREGFETMMADARAKAKASSKFSSKDNEWQGALKGIQPIEFVGYDRLTDVPVEVIAIVKTSEESSTNASSADADEEVIVVLSPTPFYAEAGGQVGDKGEIRWDGGHAEVTGTFKPLPDVTLSTVRIAQGTLTKGMNVLASVPLDVRLDTTANHTATHLLHQALKDVLGETVQQAGSLVAPDRLRFDYTYHQAPSDEQLRRVEEIVNEKIRENLEVTKTVMPIAEAKKTGAVAMFGEKYGENVRIVTAGDFSREFCGGCHVNRTGDIGLFKIVSDRSLAAGVRRMEALTGRGALAYFQTIEDAAHELQQQLNVRLEEVPAQLRAMQERQKSAGEGAQAAQDASCHGRGRVVLFDGSGRLGRHRWRDARSPPFR